MLQFHKLDRLALFAAGQDHAHRVAGKIGGALDDPAAGAAAEKRRAGPEQGREAADSLGDGLLPGSVNRRSRGWAVVGPSMR